MNYDNLIKKMIKLDGVEESTMMGTHCLRYRDEFLTMWFERENALIVKLPAERVNELIDSGLGREFNFTKKRFKQWVLIPEDREKDYEKLVLEALVLARAKKA